MTASRDSKAIHQYLSRHAEPEAQLAERLAGRFGHVLVVPAYGERESLFQLLGSVPQGPRGPVLILLVLNARANSEEKVHKANAEARGRLAADLSLAAELSPDPPARAFATDGGTLLLIDRADTGHYLPDVQGVGLARKIGDDIALALHASGRLSSPWIHNTDADALLPSDCFDQISRVRAGTACAVYFFDHRFGEDTALAQAARLYEISLRYYVLGLAWAGSPYAYQSMGSCLAIAPAAYAAVRGFPRRNAAEDFYILNKLAKVGPIARLAGAPLLLEGRASDRVPFGTGRAVRDMATSRHGLESFRLYHPLIFAHLAAWLEVLRAVARSGGSIEAALQTLPKGSPFFRADLLEDVLGRLGAFTAIREAVARSSDEQTLLRHLHTWFDGFKTRKLVHGLRDGGLASLPWRKAIAEAPFTSLSASTEEDVDTLRGELADQERRLSAETAGLAARGKRV